MMTLSWFHDPPRGLGESARTVTRPPAAGTFFRCPSAKNPRKLPSADQKGKEAPSVPSSFRGVRSPRVCPQIESRSFWLRAQKAIAIPSAVITGGPEKSPVKSKPAPGGGGRYERKVRTGSRPRRPSHSKPASSTTIAAAKIKRSLERLRALAGGAMLLLERLTIQRNSRPMSAAPCQRDSGSFARQSPTT